MKKYFNLMLAAIIICGASVFSSCANDTSDNPAQEQAKKNRKEFISHTRSMMKDLAENLNFESWNAANTLNLYFNQYVLNNKEFDKALSTQLIEQANASVQAVEEGSELAKMGYERQGTIDLTQFKYRFAMNADNTGWDVTPTTDGFEMLLNGYSPITQQIEQGLYKLNINFSGDTFKQLNHNLSWMMHMAVVMVVPTEVTFTISNNFSGTWQEDFSGTFKNQFEKRTESDYYSIVNDAWNITGNIKSNLIPMSEKGFKGDETTLNFSLGQDPKTHQSGIKLDYVHNDKSMVKLRAVGTNLNGKTDLSFLTNSSSILSIISAVSHGNSVDELTLMLNDDLITNMKVSDCQKVTEIVAEMNKARRSYADQQTMAGFADEMNKYITFSMTCKGINQEIPVRIATAKVGVDWWVMPALNFADENGYTPLVDLLDKESLEYGLNIVDHAAEPMQQSIITVRQLLQYVQTLMGSLKVNQQAN